MSNLIREKIEFALCNSELEPRISFNNENSMNDWIKSQTERHGTAPILTPCKVITRVEIEVIR